MEPIDFNLASQEWRKNKVCLEKGYFKYKCHFKNCTELLYCYTIQHKQFHLFATEFDLQNKTNPNQFIYCEEHLFETEKK